MAVAVAKNLDLREFIGAWQGNSSAGPVEDDVADELCTTRVLIEDEDCTEPEKGVC